MVFTGEFVCVVKNSGPQVPWEASYEEVVSTDRRRSALCGLVDCTQVAKVSHVSRLSKKNKSTVLHRPCLFFSFCPPLPSLSIRLEVIPGEYAVGIRWMKWEQIAIGLFRLQDFLLHIRCVLLFRTLSLKVVRIDCWIRFDPFWLYSNLVILSTCWHHLLDRASSWDLWILWSCFGATGGHAPIRKFLATHQRYSAGWEHTLCDEDLIYYILLFGHV